MKSIVFAKRNLKEILRDPLSLIFCFAFPIVMFFLFQCFTLGKSNDEILTQVPMFHINRITPAIAVFGFSFLTLFAGMLVAKDRTSSFLTRLRISPIKPVDFIIGYSIPMMLIALIQVIIVYLIALPFGFDLFSLGTLLSIVIEIPIAFFFIAAGLLFGSLFSDKSVGGMSSLLVNASAILSGMFMPLESMGDVMNIIAKIFPFYHSITLATSAIEKSFNDSLLSFVVLFIYTVLMVVVSIIVFRKKINSDKA